MPYKLKLDSVDAIVKELAIDILSNTFQHTDKVDGEKLISLTNSRQVNSFLIRSLFHEWSREVEQLESPYFDFKHEKVKDALKQFMNVLSNHISIDRSHLEPILFLALKDAILISFVPHTFLEVVLDRSDKPQDLKLQLKYIKTHREAFKHVCDHIDEFDTRPSVKQAFQEVPESSFDQVDEKAFAEKLGLSARMDELFKYEEPTSVMEVTREETVQERPQDVESFELSNTLNDQLKKEGKSLTLAEKLQHSMKKSIESGLTLNEKFMFQNALFGGDAAQMKEALKLLDTATDLNDALNKANAFNQGWDMESEEIEAFMSVLERRFS
jgi:hypothetical protein